MEPDSDTHRPATGQRDDQHQPVQTFKVMHPGPVEVEAVALRVAEGFFDRKPFFVNRGDPPAGRFGADDEPRVEFLAGLGRRTTDGEAERTRLLSGGTDVVAENHLSHRQGQSAQWLLAAICQGHRRRTLAAHNRNPTLSDDKSSICTPWNSRSAARWTLIPSGNQRRNSVNNSVTVSSIAPGLSSRLIEIRGNARPR